MPPLRSTGRSPEAEHPQYAGQYRLESVLGSGGMGVVHLATSASGLRLAVKVVHADHAVDPEFRARFRQEITAARRVSGAFTAPVVDADPEAGRPWMATLFIDGPTLAERVKRKPLEAAELSRLGAGLAEALRDIHRAGVVHRDLKPSNVLLAADGPKVIDFGISRPSDSDLRTETGKLIGTPPFMAPEQFQRPREVGPAADVFALGAVLVHAATGRGPFDSDSPYIVAYQVVHNEPDLAGVPDELAPLIARCLAKEPADRPTTDALMAALRSAGYRTSEDTQAFVPAQRPHTSEKSAPVVTTRRGGRGRWVAGAAVLAAVVVGGVLGTAGTRGDDRADDTPPDAHTRATAFRPWETPFLAGAESATGFCSYLEAALYCAGPGIKAARLDPADGAIGWSLRAANAGPGAEPNAEEAMAPTLSGGLLHVLDPEGRRLEALSPDTGRKHWSADISAYAAVRHTDSTALLLAPDGRVQALDSATGRKRWNKSLGALGSQLIAAADGGKVFAVTPSDDASSSTVKAFDPESGTALWTSRLSGGLTPVAAAEGALFLLSSNTDILATAVIRVDTATRDARRIPLTTPVDQAQATVGGDTVYVFGAGGSLLAVDTSRDTDAQSAQLWRLETSVSRASRPVAAGERVYLTAADGRLLGVDARTGALLGQTKPRMDGGRYTFTPTLPAPVAVGGRVFAGAPDGSVFAVDARDPAGW
ncbi:serine/threonine-protein kinase [Streptomyces sp. NPDC051219]|uniref:serine/threonine-protein kinase n=1 Tax=Streptomyces sp. NPDC051219 TaxID=3155283 RepID=UPI00341A54A3